VRTWTRWEDWVDLILAAWLFASPWILGTVYQRTGYAATSSWNAWLLGLAMFVVTLWTLGAPVTAAPEWTDVVLAAWTFAAPWALHFASPGEAAWNAWVVGGVICILSLWVLYGRGVQKPTPAG
jgi:hypothetical protein